MFMSWLLNLTSFCFASVSIFSLSLSLFQCLQALERHWSAFPTQFPMWTVVICFALLYLIAHTHRASFGFHLDCAKVAWTVAWSSCSGLGPKMLTMEQLSALLCFASVRFASFLSPPMRRRMRRRSERNQGARSSRFCVLFFALHYLETTKCASVTVCVPP